jgi:DNA-binding CsgD family transcriptional regulator
MAYAGAGTRKNRHTHMPVHGTRIEQAEMRTEQAEARTEQARTRTEQAETRTEQAETRTEKAEMRTEKAETRTEVAKTRTEQAESRVEQAETRTELAELRTGQAETTLRSVVNKEVDLGQDLSTRLLNATPPQAIAGRKSLPEQLTSRQTEILRLIAEGQNTKHIAEIVKISPKTVEYHRMKLMDRLKIHDVAGLVRFAMQAGLLPHEKLVSGLGLPAHMPVSSQGGSVQHHSAMR